MNSNCGKVVVILLEEFVIILENKYMYIEFLN